MIAKGKMVDIATVLAILFFPVAVLGPIVALGYIKVVQSNHPRFWFVFPLNLLVAYTILFQLTILNWGHSVPGLGYETYRILPWFAVVTGIFFLTVGLEIWKTFSSIEKIRYTIGTIVVLLFQLSARFWFQVVGPILWSEWSVCNWLMRFGLPC